MHEGLWSGNKGSQWLGWVARQGDVSEGDRNPSGMIGMISMGRVDSAKGFRPRKQQASARSHVSLISPVVGVSPPHKGVHYTFQSTKGTSHMEICFSLFWSNRICSLFLTWILFKYLKIGIISLGDFFPPSRLNAFSSFQHYSCDLVYRCFLWTCLPLALVCALPMKKVPDVLVLVWLIHLVEQKYHYQCFEHQVFIDVSRLL